MHKLPTSLLTLIALTIVAPSTLGSPSTPRITPEDVEKRLKEIDAHYAEERRASNDERIKALQKKLAAAKKRKFTGDPLLEALSNRESFYGETGKEIDKLQAALKAAESDETPNPQDHPAK